MGGEAGAGLGGPQTAGDPPDQAAQGGGELDLTRVGLGCHTVAPESWTADRGPDARDSNRKALLLSGLCHPDGRVGRLGLKLTSKSRPSDAAVSGPDQAVTAVAGRGGGRLSAPFELPLEQAIALAQFTAAGIPEGKLPQRLRTSAEEAARIKQTLLRRRLIRRDPPGRPRASTLLHLTARGKQASSWLDQLQASLPPAVFDASDLHPSGPDGALDEAERGLGSASDSRADRPLARLRTWWRGEEVAELPLGLAEPAPEPSVFERGLLNIWLGTALFLTAVVVGLLLHTERSGLAALGVGCFVALVFLSRAAIALIRQARDRRRARRAARVAELARAHDSRPHSRRAFQ